MRVAGVKDPPFWLGDGALSTSFFREQPACGGLWETRVVADDQGHRPTKSASHVWASSQPINPETVCQRCNLGARRSRGIEASRLLEKHHANRDRTRLAHLLGTLARFASRARTRSRRATNASVPLHAGRPGRRGCWVMLQGCRVPVGQLGFAQRALPGYHATLFSGHAPVARSAWARVTPDRSKPPETRYLPPVWSQSGDARIGPLPMTIQRTLCIIKPDAVARDAIGAICARIEAAGLRIVAARMLHLSRQQAAAFYAVHQGKPFFDALLDFMVSGPILAIVVRGEDAVARNRAVIGATDPALAAPGTIRADFATSVTENAVHGSDAPETAAAEIAFFFPEGICERTR